MMRFAKALELALRERGLKWQNAAGDHGSAVDAGRGRATIEEISEARRRCLERGALFLELADVVAIAISKGFG